MPSRRGDCMVEAVRINLWSKKDVDLVVGKILAQMNRDNKTKDVEILEEFLKYGARTPVIRIFVE